LPRSNGCFGRGRTIRLIVQGLARFELVSFVSEEPYLKAQIELRPETIEEGVEIEAQVRAVKDQFQQIADLVPSMPRELLAGVLMLEEPLHVVYTVTNYQRMELDTAQAILEETSTSEKLKRLMAVLAREVEVLSLGQQIQQEARTEIDKVQREYFLREQLKAIQRELGEADEQTAEVEEFRKRIDAAGMPEEAAKQARRELDRMSRLPTAAAEFGVIRGYLDWLVSLPWSRTTPDNLDLAHARQVLDQDHYGLKDVKERILEYLAVRKLKGERRQQGEEPAPDLIRREREGVILCFVGPPGVGQDFAGSIDRPGDGAPIHPLVAGRRPRRGRDPRPSPDLRGRHAGEDPASAATSRVAQSDLHARRSRQARAGFPRGSGLGAAGGARP
jgi:ATP-dependent Lon protease